MTQSAFEQDFERWWQAASRAQPKGFRPFQTNEFKSVLSATKVFKQRLKRQRWTDLNTIWPGFSARQMTAEALFGKHCPAV